MSVIDTYFAPFPASIVERLQTVRAAIAEEAPDAVEVMSYGIPTFDLNGKHLVHFAGYQRHLGFYPTAGGMAAFADALSEYKTAKGSVQFPHDRPLPLDLIRAMVRFRVATVRASSKAPKLRAS